MLALFSLADERVEAWPLAWEMALETCFGTEARGLASRVGAGVRLLLDSPNDLEEARYACEYGLLAAQPPTLGQLRAIGRRLLEEVARPVEDWGRRARL